MNAARRRWVYGVAIATVPLLIALGKITDDVAPSIVAILGALFVPGLSLANVTPDPEEADRVRDSTP